MNLLEKKSESFFLRKLDVSQINVHYLSYFCAQKRCGGTFWLLLVTFYLLLVAFSSMFVFFISFLVTFACFLLPSACRQVAFARGLSMLGQFHIFPSILFLLTLLFLLINFNVVLLLCVITSGKNMITRNYFLLIHCILSIKIFKTFITTHHKHEESVSLLLNGKIP